MGYRPRYLSATPTSVLPFCSFSLRQAGLAPCSILSLLRCLALPLKKADQTLRQICHPWPHWKVTSMGQGLPACELRRGSNLQASHMPQSHHCGEGHSDRRGVPGISHGAVSRQQDVGGALWRYFSREALWGCWAPSQEKQMERIPGGGHV